MAFVKWNDPYLTGFKVLKLNERLCIDHADPDVTHGFIVFRSHYGTVKYVAPFTFQDLLYSSPSPAFSSALLFSNLFWPDPNIHYNISDDLTTLLFLLFSFSHETVFHLTSPTLVFVLDFSYCATLFPGCPDMCHLNNDPNTVCAFEESFRQQPHVELSGFEESLALGTRTLDEIGYELGEIFDILTQLRAFCGVPPDYEPVRVCEVFPAGLSEVEAPSLVTLEEEVAEMCPLCGRGFEQWEDSVLRHNCGHVSHKNCALPVLDTKCFVCGVGEVTVL